MTYHGIALNVAPDLRAFDLIDPCGMPGTVSTSIERELGRPLPATPAIAVRDAATAFAAAFARHLDAPIRTIPGTSHDRLAELGRLAGSD